jgi:hypothetical protein
LGDFPSSSFGPRQFASEGFCGDLQNSVRLGIPESILLKPI